MPAAEPSHQILHSQIAVMAERLDHHISDTREYRKATDSTLANIEHRMAEGNVLFERTSGLLGTLERMADSGRAHREKQDARLSLLETAGTVAATERRIATWVLSWKPLAWIGGLGAPLVVWFKTGGGQ